MPLTTTSGRQWAAQDGGTRTFYRSSNSPSTTCSGKGPSITEPKANCSSIGRDNRTYFHACSLKRARGLQLTENTDFNGAKLEGVGIYNVTQKDGRRCSSYRAFIHPVRHRKNLTLLVGWSVEKLTVDGLAVTGVSIARAGERVHLKSQCETILSAGAYGSPDILMKSGVGDAEELRAVGVDPVHDLPAVGKNLQDHLDCVTTYRCADHRSLGLSWRALPQIVTAPLHYFGWKRGWMTTNYVEAGGFAKTRYADDVPDVQFHFVPAYRSVRGRLLEMGHGFAVHTCVLRPRSRGRVSLVNSDRGPQLRIDFNFLADEHDGKVLIEGLRLARRILSAPPLSEVTGQEIGPGADKTTDDQLLAYIRELARTVYHPSGTCRMGIGNDCVVRPDLTVYGMERLRVADASVMPLLVSGNTNAPSIMIGERCADFIRFNRSPHQ